VSAQSTINPNGFYAVPSTIDIDGLNLTLSKTWLLERLDVSSNCYILVTLLSGKLFETM
jgi:hypothetical protein